MKYHIVILIHEVKELWCILDIRSVQFNQNLAQCHIGFKPVLRGGPFASLTVDLEDINHAILVAQFLHQCLNGFEFRGIVETNPNLMVLNTAGLRRSFGIVSEIKGVDLTATHHRNIFLYVDLKREVVVRADTVTGRKRRRILSELYFQSNVGNLRDTVPVHQAGILLDNSMGIADPFASVAKFTDPALVLTYKVGLVVILIEDSGRLEIVSLDLYEELAAN